MTVAAVPRRRHLVLITLLLLMVVARQAPPARTSVPDSLTNEQFWSLIGSLSEPGGAFRSDNLLSNERMLQHVIPVAARSVPRGSVYLGVGPEQNFTYIAALEPSMAFIVDIRRGNLQLHLMYKALFELSHDRNEFVSRLFSRRPAGGRASVPVDELFGALAAGEPDEETFSRTVAAVREHLTKTRRLPLSEQDLLAIESIQRAFYTDGPLIQYSAYFGRIGSFPTYAELMTATDGAGQARSFLAGSEGYEYLRTLHRRNLIVPVVGDFAGPHALRAVGRYVRERDAIVGAFYLSNVEQYLEREGRRQVFCQNVSTLPLGKGSTFIRSIRDGSYLRGLGLASVTGNMLAESRACR